MTSIGTWAFGTYTDLITITVDEGNTVYDSRNDCNAIIETATNTLVAGCKNTVIPTDVTAIGDEAFSGCQGLKSITIPNSVTTIGGFAFYGCKALTNINLPNGLISIGDNAFSNCYNLTSINLPDGLTSIGSSAFHNSSLTRIVIPSSVTTIGGAAFFGCNKLTSVIVFNETPVSINSLTFDWTDDPTLYVPYGAKAAYEAADYWKDFKKIVEIMPVGTIFTAEVNGLQMQFRVTDSENWEVETYGTYADGPAISKQTEGDIVIPSEVNGYTVVGIGGWSFRDCQKITGVSLPSTLTYIGESAFRTCGLLREVDIPEGVTTIGSRAFYGFYLQKVTLPSSLQEISGDYAFNFRKDSDNIVIVKTAEPLAISAGSFDTRDRAVLFVPLGSREAYQAANYWKNFKGIYDDPVSYTVSEMVGEQVMCSTKGYVNRGEQMTVPYRRYNVVDGVLYKRDATDKQYNIIATLTEDYENNLAYTATSQTDVVYLLEAEDIEGMTPCITTEVQNNASLRSSNATSAYPADGNVEFVTLPAGVYQLTAVMYNSYHTDDPLGDYDTPWTFLADGEPIATLTNSVINYDEKTTKPFALTKETTLAIQQKGELRIGLDLIYIRKVGDLPERADIADGWYYLQNVETGQYLNRGNSWGMRAVLSDEGLPVQFTKQADESYTIYFPYGSRNRKQLYRASEEAVFVDYDGRASGCPYWDIFKADDDTYHIQTLLSNATYGDITQYLGNDPTKEASDQDGNALGVYNDVDGNVANAEGMNITWRLVPTSGNHFPHLNELRQTFSLMEGLGGYSLDEAKAIGMEATLAQIDDAISGLTAQVVTRLADATAEQPVDATPLLRNYSFNYNSSLYWEGPSPQFGADWRHDAEYFQSVFDLHQTITGLPNGNYVLRLNGFHRPGPYADVYADYKNGTDNASALLYANEASTVLANIARDAQDSQLSDYNDWAVVNYNDATQYLPDNMNTAAVCFDYGLYENSLPVTVTDGTLTIGVRLDESVEKGWVIFDDFRLDYLGPEAVEPANQLYVAESPSVIAGSKAELNISLKNSDAVNMTDFYLQLPEGMTISNSVVTIAADRSDKHQVSALWLENYGYYHIVCHSSQNNAFKENDGTLFTMTLECNADVTPGDYEAKVMNIVMSDTAKTSLSQQDFTFTIEVPDLKLGDVNGDTYINGMDIVEMVDRIMQRPSDTFHAAAADLNYDKKINGLDLVKLINLVLSQPISQTAASARSYTTTTLVPWLEAEGDALTMKIDAASDYILTQCVVELDHGMQLKNVTADDRHVVAWQRIDERHYAVVAYSTKNEAFTMGEALLKLDCTGNGSVNVSNIMLVDTDRNERFFNSAAIGSTTGVNSIKADQNREIFDLQGRKVDQRQHTKGIYIVNGKKVVVKK